MSRRQRTEAQREASRRNGRRGGRPRGPKHPQYRISRESEVWLRKVQHDHNLRSLHEALDLVREKITHHAPGFLRR